MKNLTVPKGKIDVVLDTDAYNEVDDQFAIAYLLLSKERLNTKAIYAAPFLNKRVQTPKEGMEKSYREIVKITQMMGEQVEIYSGSEHYLPDEKTPVLSPAARDLAERAMTYSEEHLLYVVAIGAITNVASAILLNPEIAKRIVVVWLGGHALHMRHTREFNLYQDIAAARVVMSSQAAFVQLPCRGVVSSFTISKPELVYWLQGKNKLADYLSSAVIDEAEGYAEGKPWTRCIWDVTAVAWLLNDEDRFMESRVCPVCLPTYDGLYASEEAPSKLMRYVYHIKRDTLMEDLIQKIAGFKKH